MQGNRGETRKRGRDGEKDEAGPNGVGTKPLGKKQAIEIRGGEGEINNLQKSAIVKRSVSAELDEDDEDHENFVIPKKGFGQNVSPSQDVKRDLRPEMQMTKPKEAAPTGINQAAKENEPCAVVRIVRDEAEPLQQKSAVSDQEAPTTALLERRSPSAISTEADPSIDVGILGSPSVPLSELVAPDASPSQLESPPSAKLSSHTRAIARDCSVFVEGRTIFWKSNVARCRAFLDRLQISYREIRNEGLRIDFEYMPVLVKFAERLHFGTRFLSDDTSPEMLLILGECESASKLVEKVVNQGKVFMDLIEKRDESLHDRCEFCMRDEELYAEGIMLRGISRFRSCVHEHCLESAPGLEKWGNIITNVADVILQCEKNVCTLCGIPGATISCDVFRGCQMVLHIRCAAACGFVRAATKNEWICPLHRIRTAHEKLAFGKNRKHERVAKTPINFVPPANLFLAAERKCSLCKVRNSDFDDHEYGLFLSCTNSTCESYCHSTCDNNPALRGGLRVSSLTDPNCLVYSWMCYNCRGCQICQRVTLGETKPGIQEAVPASLHSNLVSESGPTNSNPVPDGAEQNSQVVATVLDKLESFVPDGLVSDSERISCSRHGSWVHKACVESSYKETLLKLKSSSSNHGKATELDEDDLKELADFVQNWKCALCMDCRHCGRRYSPNGRWFENYSCCSECYERYNQGLFCSVCNIVWYDGKEKVNFLQCDCCDKWVHKGCAGTDEGLFGKIMISKSKWACPRCRDTAPEYDARTGLKVSGSRKATQQTTSPSKVKEKSTQLEEARSLFDESLGFEILASTSHEDRNSAFGRLVSNRDLCRLCGSSCDEQLSKYCYDCGESFHKFCLYGKPNETHQSLLLQPFAPVIPVPVGEASTAAHHKGHLLKRFVESAGAVSPNGRPWYCPDCIRCCICFKGDRPDELLICEDCDRSMHIDCVGLKYVPDDDWKCDDCVDAAPLLAAAISMKKPKAAVKLTTISCQPNGKSNHEQTLVKKKKGDRSEDATTKPRENDINHVNGRVEPQKIAAQDANPSSIPSGIPQTAGQPQNGMDSVPSQPMETVAFDIIPPALCDPIAVDMNAVEFTLASTQVLSPSEMYRKCALCAKPERNSGHGRLLPCATDIWIHALCAYWSSDTFTTQEGQIYNTKNAINRGHRSRCTFCKQTGGTIGCAERKCRRNYHFECACADKCTFLEDGRVFCIDHVELVKSETEAPVLADPWQPDRMNSRLYIYPDICEWGDHVSLLRTMYLKERIKHNTLTFRSGAFAVIEFGLLSLDVAEKLQQKRKGATCKGLHSGPLGLGERVSVRPADGDSPTTEGSMGPPSALVETGTTGVPPIAFATGNVEGLHRVRTLSIYCHVELDVFRHLAMLDMFRHLAKLALSPMVSAPIPPAHLAANVSQKRVGMLESLNAVAPTVPIGAECTSFENILVPVNYRAFRRYWSCFEKGKRETYLLFITSAPLFAANTMYPGASTNGTPATLDEPPPLVFNIACDRDPKFLIQGESADDAWKQLLRLVDQVRGALSSEETRALVASQQIGAAMNLPIKLEPDSHLTGDQAFGYSLQSTLSHLELLPIAVQWPNYQFRAYSREELEKYHPAHVFGVNLHGMARGIPYEKRSDVNYLFAAPPILKNYTLNADDDPDDEIVKAMQHEMFMRGDGFIGFWSDDPEIRSRKVRAIKLTRLAKQTREGRTSVATSSASLRFLPDAMAYRRMREAKTWKTKLFISHSKIQGFGVFAREDIEAGELIIEYAGELIRSILTDRREKYYEARGIGHYMFRIDADQVVDATVVGNAARFINHSCDPNCTSRIVSIDLDNNLKKKVILIFARRPIAKDEEVTYDYQLSPNADDEYTMTCRCNSVNCRKKV